MSASDTRLGMVGLGAMGSRMARRFLGAGYDVTVWNRTPEKASALGEAGARPAGTPGEVARTCGVVITMLADPDALRDVATGENGIVQHLDPSSVWVEMSTVGPGVIEELAELIADESRLLEAPVLGSLSEVENGTLTIFVAGSRPVADRLQPVLTHLGQPQYVGGRGSGAAAKLLANLTLVGTMRVLGEALALAEALTLPAETTFRILEATPLSAQAKRRKSAVLSGDYPKRFSLALARKDAHLIEEAASGRRLSLPVVEAAARWLDEAVDAGLGDADYSAVLGYMRSRGEDPRSVDQTTSVR